MITLTCKRYILPTQKELFGRLITTVEMRKVIPPEFSDIAENET